MRPRLADGWGALDRALAHRERSPPDPGDGARMLPARLVFADQDSVCILSRCSATHWDDSGGPPRGANECRPCEPQRAAVALETLAILARPVIARLDAVHFAVRERSLDTVTLITGDE